MDFCSCLFFFFFFQAEDGIRDLVRSRGLGDVYKRQRFKGKKGAAYDIFLSVIMLSFTIPMLFYGAILVREFWDYNWISLTSVSYTHLTLPTI